MAADIAREIIAQSIPPDRPSTLALVIYSRSSSGRDIRNRDETMRITAPLNRGRPFFCLEFPCPNYSSIGRQNVQGSQGERNNLHRTTLEYSACDNLEGAASCIEGYMSYRDQRDIVLFTLTDGNELGAFPLARWCLDDSGTRESGKTISRLNVLQQILKSLLVR